MGLIVVTISFLYFGYTAADVTIITGRVRTIYDRSPILKLNGSGFDADDIYISLVLAASNQKPLRINHDYAITKDERGEGLVLKLLTNRK